MKKKSQKEKVLEHLKKNNQITSMEAFELYKITRVGAVIDTLRKEGYDIETRRPKTGNYGIYVLLGTKHNPDKEGKEPDLTVEQNEFGFSVKVKKFGWPD
tara:strand:- start:16409 stop:16708 length:300 start_codon:yes stop_codon:yes gene_type:complete